jgi:hypothetical protein
MSMSEDLTKRALLEQLTADIEAMEGKLTAQATNIAALSASVLRCETMLQQLVAALPKITGIDVVPGKPTDRP